MKKRTRISVNIMEEKEIGDWVILVNEKDEQIGIKEKKHAHLDGDLHRAFSVFIFNSKRELLLQKRVNTKYHSGSLWSNTCCSHPKPGEAIQDAAIRRLREEMGLSCDLTKVFDFIYKVELDHEMVEQ